MFVGGDLPNLARIERCLFCRAPFPSNDCFTRVEFIFVMVVVYCFQPILVAPAGGSRFCTTLSRDWCAPCIFGILTFALFCSRSLVKTSGSSPRCLCIMHGILRLRYTGVFCDVVGGDLPGLHHFERRLFCKFQVIQQHCLVRSEFIFV